MALEDNLRALREFDFNDLTFDTIGTWPLPLRIIICVVLFAGVVYGGYKLHIEDLQLALTQVEKQEVELRKEFEEKAFQVANLDALRQQLAEMEETFGALLAQLPTDTEVPGLLEDITNRGLMNGLEIASIDLQPEISREFYIELPIAIAARGSYHDLGAFVSGMAGLPRIVTLHNFTISGGGDNANALSVNITAKTYRYKDGEK
jgi:type IV pilus assembly protein PilO